MMTGHIGIVVKVMMKKVMVGVAALGMVVEARGVEGSIPKCMVAIGSVMTFTDFIPQCVVGVLML
jgi:hypothetical protein